MIIVMKFKKFVVPFIDGLLDVIKDKIKFSTNLKCFWVKKENHYYAYFMSAKHEIL